MAYLSSTLRQQRGIKSEKKTPPNKEEARKVSSDFKMAAEVLSKHLQQRNPNSKHDANRTANGDQKKTYSPKKKNNETIYIHKFNKITDKDSSFEEMQKSLKNQKDPRKNIYTQELGVYTNYIPESVSFNSKPTTKTCYDSSSDFRQYNERLQRPTKYKQGVLKNKATIDKLEETYWARWKPNKTRETNNIKLKIDASDIPKEKRLGVDKSAVDYHKERKVAETNTELVKELMKKNSNKVSTEVQSEFSDEDLPPVILLNNSEEDTTNRLEYDEEIREIKHTDSFIITAKKQNQGKPKYQQPKCIKLYKDKVSRLGTYIKGGSYPLKSCLKKEEKVKSNIRFGRPASPLIVQRNSSSKMKKKHVVF